VARTIIGEPIVPAVVPVSVTEHVPASREQLLGEKVPLPLPPDLVKPTLPVGVDGDAELSETVAVQGLALTPLVVPMTDGEQVTTVVVCRRTT